MTQKYLRIGIIRLGNKNLLSYLSNVADFKLIIIILDSSYSLNAFIVVSCRCYASNFSII